MRIASFWIVWIALGIVTASNWLSDACPVGGCSFILVAFQIPQLVLGALAWLAIGVVATIAVLALKTDHKTKTDSQNDT